MDTAGHGTCALHRLGRAARSAGRQLHQCRGVSFADHAQAAMATHCARGAGVTLEYVCAVRSMVARLALPSMQPRHPCVAEHPCAQLPGTQWPLPGVQGPNQRALSVGRGGLYCVVGGDCLALRPVGASALRAAADLVPADAEPDRCGSPAVARRTGAAGSVAGADRQCWRWVRATWRCAMGCRAGLSEPVGRLLDIQAADRQRRPWVR